MNKSKKLKIHLSFNIIFIIVILKKFLDYSKRILIFKEKYSKIKFKLIKNNKILERFIIFQENL